ncbi:MAG: class III extradiol dioxygenase subunit B-like domain-containing protein [Candidatus Margulisbacteria bacterium]|nr:class III extradiol dioxygenase subunit B-like domain-containing protein [Candidatus Margulisiibacteriota bacterium]
MPHPPILVPEVGRERIKEAKNSRIALESVAKTLTAKSFDTLVIITPHGEVGRASVPVYTSRVFEGNFGQFGASKPNFYFKGDTELGHNVMKDCSFAASCPETLLDHGCLVPLYYPDKAGLKKPILPIAIAFLPLNKLFEFGKSLAKTAARLDRKIAVIASADMSHRLTPDAPAGFDPRGKEFDEKLVQLVKHNDVQGILNFDPVLADAAGQDALWSIAILLGALDGTSVIPNVLSYEGPFGVGYMVAEYAPNC